MKQTGIQWSDDTCNPTSGCDGCELWVPGVGGPCYAGNFHEARLAKSLPHLYDPSFTNVRLIPGRIAKALRCQDLRGQPRLATRKTEAKPWLDGLARKIFVGDLGDIFSAAVPFDYLKTEIIDEATSTSGQRHDLLLLTKQPARAVQFASWLVAQNIQWPDNVWIGTSITGKASLPRIRHLQQVPARYRFLSLEPLVEDPDLTPAMVTGIHQIIIGGESDQGERKGRGFDLDWARKLINLGAATSTAVFIKQLGSRPIDHGQVLRLRDKHGGDWHEWPDQALKVRQLPFGCR